MVPKTTKKDNSPLARPVSELLRAYCSVRGFDAKLALGIENLLCERREEDADFSWEKFLKEVQFLPTIARYFFRLGRVNAANPGMRGIGGLIGIPKHEINRHLPEKFQPKTLFFPKNPGVEKLRKKMEKVRMKFPLVCKPDQGERSRGVKYIANEEDLKKYCDQIDEPFLAQEAIETSVEFGVMCVRNLATKKFHVTSLAEKKLPFVVGDGESSLRSLIEKSKFTAEQKKNILTVFPDVELDTVLPGGERKIVTRAASISFGTAFEGVDLDEMSSSLREKIEHQMNRVLHKFSGFSVGRFDLRADSLRDLAEGNFKIIELNGPGGMPLEVYDPKIPIEEKYEILNQHFDAVYQVAQQNFQHGRGEYLNFFRTIAHVHRFLKAQKAHNSKTRKEVMRSFSSVLKFVIAAERQKMKIKRRAWWKRWRCRFGKK